MDAARWGDGKRHGCRAALGTPLGDGTALGQTPASVIRTRGRQRIGTLLACSGTSASIGMPLARDRRRKTRPRPPAGHTRARSDDTALRSGLSRTRSTCTHTVTAARQDLTQETRRPRHGLTTSSDTADTPAAIDGSQNRRPARHTTRLQGRGLRRLDQVRSLERRSITRRRRQPLPPLAQTRTPGTTSHWPASTAARTTDHTRDNCLERRRRPQLTPTQPAPQ